MKWIEYTDKAFDATGDAHLYIYERFGVANSYFVDK